MNEDYLWDGSGEPDADVVNMEKALGGLRYDAPLQMVSPGLFRRRPMQIAIAVAAMLVVGIGLTAWLSGAQPGKKDTLLVGSVPLRIPNIGGAACVSHGADQGSTWSVSAVAGAPRCGSVPLAKDMRLAVGGWLETDSTSSAEIGVADIGKVTVDPNSRVRLVATSATEHRLELARGRMHAVINAPPRLFLVDTPSGTAVDLGCEYTLEVDESGGSRLEVTAGYVAVAHGGRETLVPAGYLTESHPGRGPAPTVAATSTTKFRQAVHAFAFDGRTDAALDIVLSQATPVDSITVWHLLPLVTEAQCAKVEARLTALVGPRGGGTWATPRCDDVASKEWRTKLEPTWMGGSMGRWVKDALDTAKKSGREAPPK